MNDKDLEAAKKYAEGELFKPTRIKQDSFEESFLAGIQYERSRQSEVVRMSFDECRDNNFSKLIEVGNKGGLEKLNDNLAWCWQAACEYMRNKSGPLDALSLYEKLERERDENKKLRETLEFYALWFQSLTVSKTCKTERD